MNIEEMTKRTSRIKKVVVAFAAAVGILLIITSPATAQQGRGPIELDVIEIESEVPRRVAQFFVQRDRLHYQHLDGQPTFLPDLLKTVEEDPF